MRGVFQTQAVTAVPEEFHPRNLGSTGSSLEVKSTHKSGHSLSARLDSEHGKAGKEKEDQVKDKGISGQRNGEGGKFKLKLLKFIKALIPASRTNGIN